MSKRVRLIVPLFLFAAGCQGGPVALGPTEQVRRTVSFYLKNKGSADDMARLVSATQGLQSLPGVNEVSVGRYVTCDATPAAEMPADPPDAIMLLTATNQDALCRITAGGAYRSVFDDQIAPLAARFVVVDSTIEQYALGPNVSENTKARRAAAMKSLTDGKSQVGR